MTRSNDPVGSIVEQGKEKFSDYLNRIQQLRSAYADEPYNYYIIVREDSQIQLLVFVGHGHRVQQWTPDHAKFQFHVKRAAVCPKTKFVTVGEEVVARETNDYSYSGRMYLPSRLESHDVYSVAKDVTGFNL